MNGEETVFVVKPTTLFERIKQSVAKKYGVTDGTMKLQHDGNQCLNEYNPKMMEMMAGKTYHLDALLEQVGGAVSLNCTSFYRIWLTRSVSLTRRIG
jgi:hypothetical protein